jgi:hypothetical protein
MWLSGRLLTCCKKLGSDFGHVEGVGGMPIRSQFWKEGETLAYDGTASTVVSNRMPRLHAQAYVCIYVCMYMYAHVHGRGHREAVCP